MCLFAAIHSGCSKRSPSAVDSPANVLRLSQRNEPADLDPATATLPDEFFIIRALGEGLVSPAPSALSNLKAKIPDTASGISELEFQIANSAPVLPAAAERWEISPDGLTYTFHLHPAARWSNGEPVTAHDFVESYHRLLTPTTAAPKANLFFAVKNARAFATGALTDFAAVGFGAPDPLTLIVTLEHPSPRFLLYVASGPWIPVNPRVVARFGRAWTKPENHVGNGPFTLAEWRPHQRIVAKKNPHYHSASSAKLDELHFLSFDSGDTEERAYRAGQVDVTMSLPVSKVPGYEQARPAELHRAPLAETRYLSLNTSRPPLNDVRVRRALSLAIDRAKLVERVLRGGEEPAFRFVPPALRGTGDSAPSLDPAPATDALATARQLLADAGFPAGRDFPRLELSTWVNSPVVEAVQHMWRQYLGIEVAIVTREGKVHLTAVRDADYDIAFMWAIPDVPDAANLLGDFVSDAPANYPQWSDPRFDELLAAASRAPDLPQQSALLRDAEARLLAESPLIPLYFNARNWLMSSRVHGWQRDALWTRFYLHVEIAAP